MADIADIKFRFQEDEEAIDACTRLAGLLHLHQPQHVLAAEYLHEQYDPKLVRCRKQGGEGRGAGLA